MNISSNVLYGASATVGALAAGGVAIKLMSGADERRAAYETKIDGMSRDELAAAARDGLQPPAENSWGLPMAVGAATAAVGGGVLAVGGAYNLIAGIGEAIVGGSGAMVGLRAPSSVVALGLGAMAGSVIAAGAYSLLARGD